MKLEQAQARLADLNARLRSGGITPAQYAGAVNELRVEDQAGYTWQPDPSGQGWLLWDGQQWRPGALPPQPTPPPPPPQPRPLVPRASVGVTGPRPGQDWRHFKAQLLTPERFGEIYRNVPMRRRPQAWWDVLSIWAGAACGYFWLLYALVRGLPHLRIGANQQNSWLDLLPSLLLLLLPILLYVFRQATMPALTRWFNGLQRMPLSRKIGWVVAIVLAILLLQTNNLLLAQREGLDLITPLLMFAIPLGLVWFRKETDRLLLPLQVVLQPIPRILLTIIGLAAPFLVGFVLYNGMGISQYALLRWNIVIGMLLSYVILRTPEGAATGSTPQPKPAIAGLILGGLYVLYDIVARAHPALANDFLTDPFNLNDGLRTNGIAPILSGGASGANTLFVNGVEVARNFSGVNRRPWYPEEERMQRTWSGSGRIVSGQGALDWLKGAKMIDDDGKLNQNFRDWWNLLHGDSNPTDLDAVGGELEVDGKNPQGKDITIVLRDPNQPPDDDLSDLPDIDDEDLIGGPPGEPIVPPEFVEEPHVHGDREPGWVPPGEEPPPEAPPPPEKPPAGEQPPFKPPTGWEESPPPLEDLLDALRRMSAQNIPGSVQTGLVAGANMQSDDVGKWIDKIASWPRKQLEDAWPWYKQWVKRVHDTYEIHDADKLPKDFSERGLFDASRDSPLSKGLQQTLINAGASREYAEAVAKKIEADDSQRKRIAELAFKVLKGYRAAAAGAGPAVEFGTKLGVKEGVAAGGAAAGYDYFPPDPADVVKDLALAQKSQYNDSVNHWRETQTVDRWTRTGAGVSNPTTTQDVDKLIGNLQAEQRAIKAEHRNNMDQIRNDPRMRDLWAEEHALRGLRNQVADLNVLQRGMQRP